MKNRPKAAYDALERVFHEPSRLAIIAALCAADKGLPFTSLRDACTLTDGNLNRHIKLLEEAGIVSSAKCFVGVKPRTTLRLTPEGLQRFETYLEALRCVLSEAQAALPTQAPSTPRMAHAHA